MDELGYAIELRLHVRFFHLLASLYNFIGVLKRNILEHDAPVEAHSFGFFSNIYVFLKLILHVGIYKDGERGEN